MKQALMKMTNTAITMLVTPEKMIKPHRRG
jgi:hypothetical protein